MLKQALIGFALCLIMSASVMAQLVFDEGVDYQPIIPAVKTSNPGKVVVTEIFWYGCPHCFRLEPYIEKWASDLPDGVIFEQVPSALSTRWLNHARVFYSLQVMNEQKRIHSKFFDAIHIKRQRLNELDAIATFLAEQGVDEARFRQIFDSFPVDTILRKNQQKERRYGLNGVPTIIINGEYKTSVSMAGTQERLIQVIDFLVTKELD